jgi:sortase B
MMDLCMLLFCILLFLMGLYALYDSVLVYMQANDTRLLTYKPGYEGEETKEEEIQGNMVSWLVIDGTGIDYPVMQGEDNTEFLNKDPYGKYSLSGSIFLDCRNSPDFSDEYSLIYGHHMEHGLMFGALDKYTDEEYFDTHKEGKLLTAGESLQIHLFAVVEAEATETAVFSPTEVKRETTIAYIKKHARFLEEEAIPKEGTAFIGLSTCRYPSTAERILVFGSLQRLTD